MTALDKFYESQEEPTKSCLLALQAIIFNYNTNFEHRWYYRLPCFMLGKKLFCYVWIDKKTQHPYIAIGQGKKIEHPKLIQQKRTWSKILMIDPNEDIPVETIYEIFDMAMEYYS